MIPWFQYNVINIGPLPIQVWGFFVALGIGFGAWLLANAAEKKGIKKDDVYDIALWVILGSMIGARIVHISLYEPIQYIQNPIEILKVWHGGLSSFGGFIGAGLAIWLYLKRKGTAWLKGVSFMSFSGMATVPLLAGWLIGRLGCVMIHDHPGAACDCFLALNHPDQPFLDMALLEILGLLPLCIFLLFTRKKQWRSGWQLAALLIYYGVLRLTLDFWRVIDTTYAGLTPAQYLSMVMVAAGIYLLRKKR